MITEIVCISFWPALTLNSLNQLRCLVSYGINQKYNSRYSFIQIFLFAFVHPELTFYIQRFNNSLQNFSVHAYVS